MSQKTSRNPSAAPLVSVIVPVLNGERTIGSCLDSILGQSLSDIRVIVVNDASTDGTRKIIQEHAARDSRVELIENATNLDSYASRILGFNHADGRYIAACDCDDRMARGALRHLFDAAEQTGADIAHGRARALDGADAGRILPVYDPFAVKTGEAFVMAMLRNFRGWNLWGKLFRRDAWCRAAHSLPAARVHTADDLLICFAIGLEAMCYQRITKPVYLYSQPKEHAFSSGEKALKNATDHIDVLGALFALAAQRGLGGKFPELLERLTKHILLSMARNLHGDAAIRNAVAAKVASTLGAEHARWAIQRGLSGDAMSRRVKRGGIGRLMSLQGEFLRHVLECDLHECRVTVSRVWGAARRRGWRAVTEEMTELRRSDKRTDESEGT